MKFWDWLKCRLPRWMGKWAGHRKGRATGEILPGLRKVYKCPRCGARWDRKMSEPKQAPLALAGGKDAGTKVA